MKLNAEIKRVIDEPGKRIKAVADVIIDDSIAIHNVNVVEGSNGLFIAMPSKTWTDKSGEKKSRDIVHPISSSARKEISDAVLTAYKATLNN